jgi:hypothetical protein
MPSWNFPICHHDGVWGRRKGSSWCSTLCPVVALGIIVNGLVCGGRIVGNLLSLGVQSGSGAAVKSNKRLEDERVEVMGLDVHSGTSFICLAGNSVMIHFPRKRYLSISTTCAIRTWDRGAKKFGSLKDFEVHCCHALKLANLEKF